METLNLKLVRLMVLMLAAAAVLSGGLYAYRHYEHYQLEQAQNKAEARTASQAASAVKHLNTYRLDSTRRATERQQLVRDALILQRHDENLSAARPEPIDLPASPPRE